MFGRTNKRIQELQQIVSKLEVEVVKLTLRLDKYEDLLRSVNGRINRKLGRILETDEEIESEKPLDIQELQRQLLLGKQSED